MASEVKTNKVSPSTGTTLSVGDSGDTLALATDAVTGFQVGSDAAGDVLYHDGTDYTRLAKPGTPAGEVLTFATSATAPSWVAGGGGLVAVTFLTTVESATHTFNTDATKARFRVQAGGGGGSSAMNSGGAEGWVGSNGGYIEAWVDISPVLMTNCTVVVGAAGTAGGYGPGPGGTGGTSSVALPVTTPSVTLTCTGGGGGTVTTYSTTLSSPGLATVVGTTLAQLLLDSESNSASWNKFGLSPIGGTAGRPFYVSGPTVGTWGAPGGPGGNQGSTHREGEDGGQGIVIIEEYI